MPSSEILRSGLFLCMNSLVVNQASHIHKHAMIAAPIATATSTKLDPPRKVTAKYTITVKIRAKGAVTISPVRNANGHSQRRGKTVRVGVVAEVILQWVDRRETEAIGFSMVPSFTAWIPGAALRRRTVLSGRLRQTSLSSPSSTNRGSNGLATNMLRDGSSATVKLIAPDATTSSVGG